MKWYLRALKKYAVFSGRSSRKEYWMFELWNTLITFFFFIIFTVIVNANRDLSALALLPVLYPLATIVPSLAETVRRLHDTNRDGYWFFIGLVPLIGPFIMLSWMLKAGDPGDNRFGPSPYAQPKPTLEEMQMGYLAPPLDPR